MMYEKTNNGKSFSNRVMPVIIFWTLVTLVIYVYNTQATDIGHKTLALVTVFYIVNKSLKKDITRYSARVLTSLSIAWMGLDIINWFYY